MPDALDQYLDRTFPVRRGKPAGTCKLCDRAAAGSAQLCPACEAVAL